MTTQVATEWLEQLAVLETPEQRRAVLRELAPGRAAEELHQAVLAAMYNQRPRALRLHAAMEDLAALSGDPAPRAWAARSRGHIQHVTGDYAAATHSYQEAAVLFESQGMDVEVGRTLSSGLQALIYRGEYERAIEWASRAEAIFQRHGDLLRLARLDSNVGNIYFRQDRPKDAIARYHRALEGFEVVGEPRDIAAALSNLAVSNISLGQFAEALCFYQRARDHCEEHGLSNLAARADYNIAYLHYLRGDYARARQLYQISRERCRESGDAYHAALCDLDEAEMVLDLNLIREGDALARRAMEGFAALGMPYEQAKALINLAVAASHRRDYARADKTLLQARRLFVEEKNPVWPALVDQLRAVLAFHELRYDRARRLSTSAWRVLTRTMVPGRAAHCQILLSRLWLRTGYPDRARALSRAALEHAGETPSPSLRFHACMVEGEIHEKQGRSKAAVAAYESARLQVDDMRGRVDTEDLRISLLSDKLAVYEGLVSLYLDTPTAPSGTGVSKALLAVQQAKSRSLADRLGVHSGEPDEATEADPGFLSLRRDLNGIYRQLELAVAHSSASGGSGRDLRERAAAIEAQLLEARRHAHPVPDPEAVLEPDTSALQRALRNNELLLEYYEARGTLYVFLLSRDRLEVVRLGNATPIRQLVRLFAFQMGKVRWGQSAQGEHAWAAAADHLRALYRLLFTPIEDRLQPFEHLFVAPHRELHGLPFAALDDGRQVLGERFTLSVTPSASVLARCRVRPRTPNRGFLVMAVPDASAPRIHEEAQVVATTLPGSILLAGPEATSDAFWRLAPAAQLVHLAAHGVFRRDNPMFSALQLADERLSLLDLSQKRLPLDLLTLSACQSGASVSAGGDELLGLMRGFLSVGVRSLLVTLWEIDDATATEFMRNFYQGVRTGLSLGAALQSAMQEIRARHPHPNHWAPYVLVGDPDPMVGPDLGEETEKKIR